MGFAEPIPFRGGGRRFYRQDTEPHLTINIPSSSVPGVNHSPVRFQTAGGKCSGLVESEFAVFRMLELFSGTLPSKAFVGIMAAKP